MYTYEVEALWPLERIAPSRSRREATIRAASQSSRFATSRIVSPERRVLVGNCQPLAGSFRIQTLRSPKNGTTTASCAEAGGYSRNALSRLETNAASTEAKIRSGRSDSQERIGVRSALGGRP